jgi:hypothetical protein
MVRRYEADKWRACPEIVIITFKVKVRYIVATSTEHSQIVMVYSNSIAKDYPILYTIPT